MRPIVAMLVAITLSALTASAFAAPPPTHVDHAVVHHDLAPSAPVALPAAHDATDHVLPTSTIPLVPDAAETDHAYLRVFVLPVKVLDLGRPSRPTTRMRMDNLHASYAITERSGEGCRPSVVQRE